MASAEQQTSAIPVSESTAVQEQEHAHSCDDPSHHHHHHDHPHPDFFNANDLFSSLNAATKTEKVVKRKAKKNRPQQTIRAETIPGNRGTDNIDDLVNFINNPTISTNDKKSKKKSSTTTN